MKKPKRANWQDLFFVIGTACFFFSCIATTLQVAKTNEPGEVEMSAGYMQGRNYEEFDASPLQLIGVNGRIGVANNFDMGFEHTFDVSKDNEGMYKTIWGDAKYQITNHNDELKKLTFSSGLLKGYLYDKEAKIHMTTLPLYFSSSVSERFTPTFIYRYELNSEKFFPDSESFDNSRHTFSLGFEYYLKQPDPSKWNPKFGFSIGTNVGNESNIFLINFGFKFSSPYK